MIFTASALLIRYVFVLLEIIVKYGKKRWKLRNIYKYKVVVHVIVSSVIIGGFGCHIPPMAMIYALVLKY